MKDNQDKNREINSDEKLFSSEFIKSHYVVSIYRRPYPKSDPRYDESFEVKNDSP